MILFRPISVNPGLGCGPAPATAARRASRQPFLVRSAAGDHRPSKLCFDPSPMRLRPKRELRASAAPSGAWDREKSWPERLVPVCAQHRFEFFDEVVDVFELAVDRREADESDLVDGAEAVEHLFADVAGRN